ncbi:metallochaperone AztD [Mangrovicoccus algicola]|uniref:Metallochaperone AztD n=1 Tax=Mangrovicoccus algicola TaxID=2771008 RepID=A0A8J6YXX8_9RHOB|nr:metallochaperone AztD [Mangrovicoccus algicola]MBE3638569.1 metallochaperone AztD [Mangrovicoccus algicola]
MTRHTLALGSLALAALAGAPAMADEDRETWRIFVADQASAAVTAFDLEDPGTQWRFDLGGPSKLYVSPSGQGIVAVQSDDDRVDFLSTGIVLEGHGDHADIEVSDPARIDAVLEGPRPFHVVTHGGLTAINFDRGGEVAMLEEAALLEGRLDAAARFAQNRAHHGFAAPMGDYVLSSVASEAPVEGDGAPPRVGLQAYDAEGRPAGEMQACTDLHGEAFSGAYLVAGCKEGIATAHLADGQPVLDLLPYPAELPEGHTGTLLGSAAMQVFLGNYGADGVVVIDPVAAPHFRHVALPFRRVDFVLDDISPQYGYILTEDGTLHRLNLLSGEIEASARVTGPYSMDGHWRDPRPRLAMAGEALVLTDPAESAVRVIDTDSLAETAAIAVEGLPYNIVATGGAGLTH